MRYAECDRMGFVHHSVYAMYLEEARTEILRSFGITYKQLEDEGYLMPVRSMDYQFYKAAKYDDLLTIKVRLEEMPKIRWKFTYEIADENGELLSTANTELFFVKKQSMRPCTLPHAYMQEIEKIFHR